MRVFIIALCFYSGWGHEVIHTNTAAWSDSDLGRTFVETIINVTNDSCTRLDNARIELLRSMSSDMLPERYIRNVVGDRRWLWGSTLREEAAGVESMVDNFMSEAGCSPSFKRSAVENVQHLSKRLLDAAIATQEHHHIHHTNQPHV